MRRAAPLRRRVPLRSRSALRTAAARPTSRSRSSGGAFGATVVELALERAGYSCEICGRMLGDRRGTDWHAHHRRPRAAGGTSDPAARTAANCLIACPSCHSMAEVCREAARVAGWLVPQGQDPAAVPVLLAGDARWVLLTLDGRYREAP